ncbi:MAG: chromosome segregation protein SMC [Bacteroidota bacterium]
MRLNRLVIKGFKSFANETVINFQEDVIGIVGPNGSGKSNVVDAVRWVLGEQKSRELRLDQMSSVIFNGTKKRKPGGKASVSLTFDNTKNILPTEYQSVTITRSLYRSGESEYQLNGVTCRLKDITSLFLDTGIGSNSYAIIALGMVDDILADKDNSRRRMFEQAAGISKYKVRKRETLNKLKNTSEDLDRIEDLLFEINNNLKALEKQARRTKRYFEIKEQYKTYSIDLAVIKINNLKDRFQDLKAQLEKEQDQYRNYDAAINKLEAELEQVRKANLDKERALSSQQRELNALVGRLRGKENEKQMLLQKRQFVEQTLKRMNEEISSASQRLSQLTEDIEYYRSELNQEKRLEAKLEEDLERAEAYLKQIRDNHGSLKADLDQVISGQQALEKGVFELEKQKAVNSNKIENFKQQLSRDTVNIQNRREEISGLQEKRKQLEQQETQYRENLEQLELAEVQRQSKLQATEQELEVLTKELTKVNRQLDAKRNEYKLTKSMVENLEGFPESIRFLSSTKEWNKEAPLLSDLIYVQESYRVAIENYLEPYLNYYVVANVEEAQKAISLLNRSQKGKANFFILDAFKDYVAPMALFPDTMRAIELVETDAAYANLCSYLLENVLVTDKEELPNVVADQDVVILSQSGRFIRRRYSVSGGSVGLFEGKKIGRKKNLEVLEAVIQKTEKKENKLSTAFYNLKGKLDQLKIKHTTAEMQAVQKALNRLGQERASLNTRLENYESFIQEVMEKHSQMEQQIKLLEKTNKGIDEELGGSKANLQKIRAQIANTDGSFRQVAEQLSKASADFNEKNIAFIRQQNKVAVLQRELTFREKQLEETRTKITSNQSNLVQSEQEQETIDRSLNTLEQDLAKAYEERKAQTSLLSEAEQKYFKARGAINELEDQIRKTNRNRTDAQVLINKLKEKFSDIKFEITSLSQRVKIEFSVEINDLINQEPSNEIPIAELEVKVDRLKSRIDNYGEINPMAVEAYDEMKERHDTISKQRDDIVQAKDSLLETIKEIEETATSQFLYAFEKARLYFIDVFRSLFSEEDNCDLILLSPDDPLDSKIEIVAKPKGKRPQTISQLSGGEKTLTATALLFALYLLKPAPFCIFDEVDAPLDDANIMKFNRIIKKFSQDSQFIIVTHNKLTMAAVDAIYGVFNDGGVSGVTQVDFRDFDHTATFEAKPS